MQVRPWGSLVGVRPSKQLHKLLDTGLEYDQAMQFMEDTYQISNEKFALLWQVCQKERPFILDSSHPRLFSVYVGIPFCPTRCLYCSFPSHSLTELNKLRRRFIECLLSEIQETGRLASQLHMQPYSVYLGGGTPTALDPDELQEIVVALKVAFPGTWREFTVEAGRPDTINRAHLDWMKKHGVSRISVNPQTMHDHTLATIGRHHSIQDVKNAVLLVRETGIPVLNMDLIIGLPDETEQIVKETVRQTLLLKPENVTLHIFSRKRASRFNENKDSFELAEPPQIRQMHKAACDMLAGRYEPYYLYRQRDILAGLENIGFSIPGHVCVYNMAMIEERHHILGLGGGATSKIVYPDYSLQNIATPKDVRIYIDRLKDLNIKRSEALTDALKKWENHHESR